MVWPSKKNHFGPRSPLHIHFCQRNVQKPRDPTKPIYSISSKDRRTDGMNERVDRTISTPLDQHFSTQLGVSPSHGRVRSQLLEARRLKSLPSRTPYRHETTGDSETPRVISACGRNTPEEHGRSKAKGATLDDSDSKRKRHSKNNRNEGWRSSMARREESHHRGTSEIKPKKVQTLHHHGTYRSSRLPIRSPIHHEDS